MATRNAAHPMAFHDRPTDSATGVTRDTAQRLAERLGVDETQAIHPALHDMAGKLLPPCEADDGPLHPSLVRAVQAASRATTA